MLSYEMSLYQSNTFIETENNYLNFDSFLQDCEVNSHKFNKEVYKIFINIEDF